MLSRKATLLAILVVLSLSVQKVYAHLPANSSITPHAAVYSEDTGQTCVVRAVAESQCDFYSGSHDQGDNHLHRAVALLQAYLHEPGGYPRNDDIAVFRIEYFRADLRGEDDAKSPFLRVYKTAAAVEYETLAAPPKIKPRRILTTIWAEVKQS